MAGLAALLDKEAGAEIEAMLSEAKTKASEIVATAAEEAKAIVTQRERGLAAQHEAAIVRAKSAAQLEASSLKLKAQNEAVETVYSKAEAEIQALMKDKKKYPAALNALLKEAADAVGKVATVMVNPADKDLVELKGAKIETDDKIVGGVRVRGEGRSVVIENSLMARLETLRDELASEVSKILNSKG